ncbi:hypothetical protein H0H92_002009 [Tricholoma furcatifolium]|nr:hypothetical protein H0H92_002009 [Tricholoma furcatifolium]
MSTLEPYECTFVIPPNNQPHRYTIIWLHGLGDSGRGMLPFANDMRKRLIDSFNLCHIKFILPTAHRIPITAMEKRYVSAWFDISSFNLTEREEDEEGTRRAARMISDIIEKEEKDFGVPPERVIVGGFSQGSAAALITALTCSRRLAGVFVLGGYVPLRSKIKELSSYHASSLPIFWGHGRDDERLDISFSLKTAVTLASDLGILFASYHGRLGEELEREDDAESGFDSDTIHELGSDIPPVVSTDLILSHDALRTPAVRFVAYDQVGHFLDEEELVDLNEWLGAVLSDPAAPSS